MRNRKLVPYLKQGYSIDCNYMKRVMNYLPCDEWEIVEIPIISITIGVWE